MLMGSAKSHEKKHKKESNDKKIKGLDEELNIQYHDVNPEWNYTISPRAIERERRIVQ